MLLKRAAPLLLIVLAACAQTSNTPAPRAALGKLSLNAGTLYTLRSDCNDQALQFTGGSADNLATALLAPATGSVAQQWLLQDAGDGYFALLSGPSGKALDAEAWGTADGTRAVQWPYLNQANQQWQLLDQGDGHFAVVNRNSGKRLDASGTPVDLASDHGTCGQRWAVAPVQTAVSLTLYAAPDGTGSACSQALPCALLTAQAQARRVSARQSGDLVVQLADGLYTLDQTLRFDANDSGTDGHAVIYQGAPGGAARLSGARRIQGWQAVDGGVYRTNVGSLRFRSLSVNGVPALRARTPNVGDYFRMRNWDDGSQRLEVNASDVAPLSSLGPQLNQVEVVVQRHWNVNRLRLADLNFSGDSAYLVPQSPEREKSFQQRSPWREPGQAYHLEGSLAFLDQPGEFFLDSDSGDLYYKPRPGEDLSGAEVLAPILEQVMTVRGDPGNPVSHLHFRNLTFEGADWLAPSRQGFLGIQAGATVNGDMPGGVMVTNAIDLSFERSTFRLMGASGLYLVAGVRDSQVIGCHFEDLGGEGVGLDDTTADGYSAPVSGVAVLDNSVTRIGTQFAGSVGIFVGYADHARIEHNAVWDVPYTAISVGWGWSAQISRAHDISVRYNDIHDAVNLLDDGAGIYTLSDQPGTVIAENYLHDINPSPWGGGNPVAAVYLDEGSSHITVQGNVIQNVSQPLNFNVEGGHDNTVQNNEGADQATIENAGPEAAYR